MASGATGCPRPAQAALPGDFPVYPGARLIEEKACTGFTGQPAGVTELVAKWSTPDPGQQVVTFYADRLSRGRWMVVNVFPAQAGGAGEVDFAAHDDASLSGSVAYIAGDGSGEIDVGIFVQR